MGHHFSSTLHRGKYHTISIIMKVFAISCLLALAGAAPAPEADPQYLAGLGYHAPVGYHAANCVTEEVILVTQVCTPSAEPVCSMETVQTQEIEYEKVCKEIVNTICDQPAAYHSIGKREADAEADAEADPQYFAHPYAHAAAIAPIAAVAPIAAHAVAHSVTATVKHACREVTTEHCVDNPKIKLVPVEVEHCHTVTKVSCADVENKLPKTTCEQVVTEHVSHAVAPAVIAGGYYGRK